MPENKIDITSLIPALMDVFRKPIYDANFSGQTRVPAMELLNKIKVDTKELVPFIAKNLASISKVQADGYHPYQRMTIKLLGRLGEHGEAAVPTLEAVVADPAKFGCSRSHPDYSGFISDSQESMGKIKSALAAKGARK